MSRFFWCKGREIFIKLKIALPQSAAAKGYFHVEKTRVLKPHPEFQNFGLSMKNCGGVLIFEWLCILILPIVINFKKNQIIILFAASCRNVLGVAWPISLS